MRSATAAAVFFSRRMNTWDWQQRFSLRASTFLLLYVLLLFGLGALDATVGSDLPEPAETWLQASGWSSEWLLLVAAALSGAFFLRSLWQRQPQLQFLLELLVAVGTYAAMPSY
jgi:cation transport ATPase